MTQFFHLTKRNLRLYFRDKGALFASMLSMIIVIGLMLFFLGDIGIERITSRLTGLPGHDAAEDLENAKLLMLVWTVAGIIPINAVMVTLSALSSIIKDKSTGKINSIYTSPISRFTITISYIAAACIASILVCSITFAISELYLCMNGLTAFTVKEHIQMFGMILVNSFTYSAIMYLCATLVKSEGAWSGLGTVIGTLVGFFGGIYMPIGELSDVLVKAINCTPVIYGTAMFRGIMTTSITDATFAGAPAEMVSAYRKVMGIDLEAFGTSISDSGCVMIVLGFGILITLLGVIVTTLMKRKDR